MQRNVIITWLLILIVTAVINETAKCSPENSSLSPFPASALNELILQPDEVPPEYKLITNTNLLMQAGLSKNPDYLTRRADLEDVIQMDGAAVFLALYGSEESARLMVKGVFFRKAKHAMKYAKVQGTRKRLVAAFRRDTTDGIWLLFIARDPELTYDDTELELITQGLEAYQRRLTLSSLFDQINADAAKRK
jgi:hypothetical protein